MVRLSFFSFTYSLIVLLLYYLLLIVVMKEIGYLDNITLYFVKLRITIYLKISFRFGINKIKILTIENFLSMEVALTERNYSNSCLQCQN